MRTLKYILEYFTTNTIDYYSDIFTSDRYTQEEKLSAAMKVLDIDKGDFENIPFYNDKKFYLDYKYYLAYFETYPSLVADSYELLCLGQIRTLSELAASVIRESSLMTKHKDVYSKFAQGLSSLYQRSGLVNQLDDQNDKSTDFSGSVLMVGEKPGGIEPGFMGVHHDDFINLLVIYFEDNAKAIIEFINKYNGAINSMINLALKYKERSHEIPSVDIEVFSFLNESLSKCMYKLDYRTDAVKRPSLAGQTPVYLTKDDVLRTATVTKYYSRYGRFIGDGIANFYVNAKNSTALNINSEAILETLSNDFASFFMQVQQQKLFKTTYKNGALKFMAQAAWVKNSEQFGHKENRKLVGGGKDDINNYRGINLVMPRRNITSVTDDSIINLPRYLIPLLFTGDYDKIGSQGQNVIARLLSIDERTGKKIMELVGIDFGHTLREENPFLTQDFRGNYLIKSDGRFTQPRGLNAKSFKNFSALTDGSLSEKMQGVLILAKLQGRVIHRDVINSYGKEFADYYVAIPVNGGSILCDNYIAALKKLKIEEYENQKEYEYYIEKIEAFKLQMNRDMKTMVDIFEIYLNCSAQEIDLADNLSKLGACVRGETSLRSEDKQHGLKHLVMQQAHPKVWKVEQVNNEYIYSCSYITKINEIEQVLQAKNNQHFRIERCGNNIRIKFLKTHLNEICELFSEEKIMQKYHPEDYVAIQAAYAEIELRNLLEAPWFLQQHISMELSQNSDNTSQYKLRIKADKEANQRLIKMFEKQFVSNFVNNVMTLAFDGDSGQVKKMIQVLTKIEEAYDLDKDMHAIKHPDFKWSMNETKLFHGESIIHCSFMQSEIFHCDNSLPEFKSNLQKLLKFYDLSSVVNTNKSQGSFFSYFWSVSANTTSNPTSTSKPVPVELQQAIKAYLENESNLQGLVALLMDREEMLVNPPKNDQTFSAEEAELVTAATQHALAQIGKKSHSW
jgi:hypothetical protein